MAYKISDTTKVKLDSCCKACSDSLFGTKLQKLGDDLDSSTTNKSVKFVVSELAKLSSMCEGNKAIAGKMNLLIDKLLDITKPDIPIFTVTEVNNINHSCSAFEGMGTVLNSIIEKVNLNEVGADITFSAGATAGGATITASTTETGTLAWTSSVPTKASIDASTGVITPLVAGETNIIYLSSTGKTNIKVLTIG